MANLLRCSIRLFSLILGVLLFGSLPVNASDRTITNSIGMEFVLIPAGTFKMGSPKDELNRESNEREHEDRTLGIETTFSFDLIATIRIFSPI